MAFPPDDTNKIHCRDSISISRALPRADYFPDPTGDIHQSHTITGLRQFEIMTK
jgi:hypothetical protein